MKGIKLLILDDYQVVRAGIRKILSEAFEDYEIVESESVDEAISVITCNRMDIAIVDINLNNESGFDFIKKAKRIDCKLKYIVFTGSVRQSDYLYAKEIGIDGYIIKNAYAEDLVYGINVVMRNQKFYSVFPEKKQEHRIIDTDERLTRREVEVLRLLEAGLTNQEIGNQLFISEATTKKHVSNVLSKLGLRHRVEVVLLNKN